MKRSKIYPNCLVVTRTVKVGGLTKLELRQALQANAISMNEHGERLFADERFTPSETRTSLSTVELTVGNLGFLQGAVLTAIYDRATELGLDLCPLELGPYLRLQYLDQPEGHRGKPVRQNQAPYGSITIASKPLAEDHDVPKGFYLRRIEGVLWLRGYRCWPQNLWAPDDHFVFIIT